MNITVEIPYVVQPLEAGGALSMWRLFGLADRPHGLVGPVPDDCLVRVHRSSLGEAQRDQLESHDGWQLRQDRMTDRRLVDAPNDQPLSAGGRPEGWQEPVAIGRRAYEKEGIAGLKGHSAAMQQVLALVALGEHARGLPKLERTLPSAHGSGTTAHEHERAVGEVDGIDLRLLDEATDALDGCLQIATRQSASAQFVSQAEQPAAPR